MQPKQNLSLLSLFSLSSLLSPLSPLYSLSPLSPLFLLSPPSPNSVQCTCNSNNHNNINRSNSSITSTNSDTANTRRRHCQHLKKRIKEFPTHTFSVSLFFPRSGRSHCHTTAANKSKQDAKIWQSHYTFEREERRDGEREREGERRERERERSARRRQRLKAIIEGAIKDYLGPVDAVLVAIYSKEERRVFKWTITA